MIGSIIYFHILFIHYTLSLKLPNCTNGEVFEVSSLNCCPCPQNALMSVTYDGLSCSCASHSILTRSGLCVPCNVTETVSADGSTCVPRKCQAAGSRIVCRKCPNDSISLTQNHDGSPLKEVLCVKCARGYVAKNNVCVQCESCICTRNEVTVLGKCLPKKYVMERPKYAENQLHPADLLNIVKHEYMCTINDISSCRWLANACVSNFYSSDPAGPCRLWFYPNLVGHKFLPMLTVNNSDRAPNEINLSYGKSKLFITAINYNTDGSFQHLSDTRKKAYPCLPPFNINIGVDISEDCFINLSELSNVNDLNALLISQRDYKFISISIRKPNSQLVQKGLWSTKMFTKYFLIRRSLSPTSNITSYTYLRTMTIHIKIARVNPTSGSLKIYVDFEAQYAVKSLASKMFVTSLKIENNLPNAGIHRGLEITGTIFSVLMAIYAATQWRGTIRRGGIQISIVPILAGCIADALYFATWCSVIHSLAAEAGTLSIILPISRSEEYLIEGMIFTSLTLKAMKAAYINWTLCRCDILLIDWSEYNQCITDALQVPSNDKKRIILAKEWASMQTKRRTSPLATAILTLLMLHVMVPWQKMIPESQGYSWAVSVIAWWSSYAVVFLGRMVANRLLGCPTTILLKLCVATEFSLLVFQEELYAHYVHGRNEDASEYRYLSGPLSACRVVCAVKFRAICKQITQSVNYTSEKIISKEDLMSRFLAAFFERVEYSACKSLIQESCTSALDGLSWVACERTVLEKLLNVEISVREEGNTSVLLYDAECSKPSCFEITWWGNEWTLATLDSTIYGCVLYVTKEPIYAAFTVLISLQITKSVVTWFGNKNVLSKTNVKSF